MNTVVRPAGDASVAEVVAVCELCGTIRRYDLAKTTEQLIIGGTCPKTSPEPA
jgi:RNase P subunit RPR2